MRCEIGWPIATVAGRLISRRADVRLDFGHRTFELSRRFKPHIQFADVDTFGVLVEFGASAAATDMRDFRHLADQHLRLLRQL